MINRFKGLFGDTWWLWAAFLLLGFAFSWLVSPVFLVTIPVLAVSFVYYAAMRYDDSGNHKGEGD